MASFLLTPGLEKPLQQGAAGLLPDPADHLRPMVAGRLLEDPRPVIDAAALGTRS
jgi:hypothetical protein